MSPANCTLAQFPSERISFVENRILGDACQRPKKGGAPGVGVSVRSLGSTWGCPSYAATPGAQSAQVTLASNVDSSVDPDLGFAHIIS